MATLGIGGREDSFLRRMRLEPATKHRKGRGPNHWAITLFSSLCSCLILAIVMAEEHQETNVTPQEQVVPESIVLPPKRSDDAAIVNTLEAIFQTVEESSTTQPVQLNGKKLSWEEDFMELDKKVQLLIDRFEQNRQPPRPPGSLDHRFGPKTTQKMSWPELVGLAAEEADRKIMEEMPAARVVLVPPLSVITCDFRRERVWLYVDYSGKVVKPPTIG